MEYSGKPEATNAGVCSDKDQEPRDTETWRGRSLGYQRAQCRLCMLLSPNGECWHLCIEEGTTHLRKLLSLQTLPIWI